MRPSAVLVGLAIRRSAVRLLRRGIRRGAGVIASADRVPGLNRQAQVQDFQFPAFRAADVFGLQVAVDDAPGMRKSSAAASSPMIWTVSSKGIRVRTSIKFRSVSPSTYSNTVKDLSR